MSRGKTYYRPNGSDGPFYSPSDSIVALLPMSVQMAVDAAVNPDYKEFQEMIYKLGATPEGLQEAAENYKKYFEILLKHEADESPQETFVKASFDFKSPSFLLFQSMVAGALMATYHESLVDMKGEMVEWRETFMRDAITAIDMKYKSNKEETNAGN
jgi:hypothetical protein